VILNTKLEKPYEQYTTRSLVWLRCDYCGAEFQRIKKSRERLNKIIPKDSCGSKACTRTKKEEVCLLQHGTSIIFQSESFKTKQRNTNITKFGTEEYFDSLDFKQKRRDTLLEKYGVESPLQSTEVRERQENTCLTRYGVTNYAQAADFTEKRSATNLQKYGVEHAMQHPDCVKKREETSHEKYGVDNYTQTPEYWERRKQTCLDRYGVEHPFQVEEIRQKALATNLTRHGNEHYAKTEEFRQRFIKTCLDKYGVPNPLCLQKNQIYGKTQTEIQDWLTSIGTTFEQDYSLLGDREIDLYNQDLKIGIEYCGLFWHNELSPNPRLRFYHYNKHIDCETKNVRLITIFEDEWKHKPEQCKGILRSILNKPITQVFARKCQIRESNRHEFHQFCEQYHLLGSNNLGRVFYVLVYQDEIIAGMSLGRHHRKNNELTLDRLCFKSGTQITGGASKLFKKCKEWATNQGYEKISTWSDNRWSQGNIYQQLGFTLDKNILPDYSYVNAKKPTMRLTKQSQKKSNTNCPIDKTESEWSLENGLARIWDCGKKRWVIQLS
jgi:hypothetical protein